MLFISLVLISGFVYIILLDGWWLTSEREEEYILTSLHLSCQSFLQGVLSRNTRSLSNTFPSLNVVIDSLFCLPYILSLYFSQVTRLFPIPILHKVTTSLFTSSLFFTNLFIPLSYDTSSVSNTSSLHFPSEVADSLLYLFLHYFMNLIKYFRH